MSNEQLDEKVLYAVAHGQKPVAFSAIYHDVGPSNYGFREVDRSLQRLKKMKKIEFRGRGGWCLMEGR